MDVAHIDRNRLVVVVVEPHHGIGRVEVVLVVFREELVKVFLGQVAVKGGKLLCFDGDVRKTLPQHGQIPLLVAEGQEDLHLARLAVDDGNTPARAAHRLADAHAEDIDILIRGALEGEAAVKAAEHAAHAAREVRRGKDERQSLGKSLAAELEQHFVVGGKLLIREKDVEVVDHQHDVRGTLAVLLGVDVKEPA